MGVDVGEVGEDAVFRANQVSSLSQLEQLMCARSFALSYFHIYTGVLKKTFITRKTTLNCIGQFINGV